MKQSRIIQSEDDPENENNTLSTITSHVQKRILGFVNSVKIIGVYVLLSVLLLVATVLLTIFVLFYTLVMIGPILGSWFDAKERIRHSLDVLIDIEDMTEFRNDLKDIVGKHYTGLYDDNTQNRELRQEIEQIHRQAKEDSETGDVIIALVSGVLSIIVSTISSISLIPTLITTYGILMAFATVTQVTIIDVLAFDDAQDRRFRQSDLLLMLGWNRAVLQSRPIQAVIIAIGIVKTISESGYEIAKILLGEILEQDMSGVEASVFIGNTVAEIIEWSVTGTNESKSGE